MKPQSVAKTGTVSDHLLVRSFAALLSGLTALLYLLIGLRVLIVLEGSADQTWALAPAAAYGLGLVLLLLLRSRWVWVLGAALQVFVIFTYFNLAPQRIPTFEFWGMLIRVVQALLLLALAYLALRRS
ncbi:MAG: hypothetical protein HXY40_17830 [Chloroflexi bacterium]|nr:hypothetical protein [Chloroflexota bacterium]